MEDFKADILIPNKKGRFYFNLSLGVIIVVIAVLTFLQIIPIFLQIFSFLIWLFALSNYIAQTKKQVLKKSVGDLKLTSDQISILGNSFNLKETTSVKISISGWKSYKRSNDRHQPISDLHKGDKNFLTVTSRDRNIKCEFLLTSKEHWLLLREHVLNWYYCNLNVAEDNNGGRSYGLECLTYKEIQEFKRNIQASKISQA
jgi:hypothetical protein